MTNKKQPSKENSQFQHPLPKHWLRPYLFGLDDLFYGRWDYWTPTIQNGKPLDEPIPKINFDSTPHPITKINLTDCINFMGRHGYDSRKAWSVFVDWLLWGLGSALIDKFPTEISEEISWYWYTHFDMSLLLLHPTDYMAWGSCELANMSHSGNANGYFPTPMPICIMMSKLTQMQIQAPDKDIRSKVIDPCLGTGSMLLEASNHSLRLYGQDISLDMVKMSTVNAWLYIPWLAYNADDLIDWNTLEDYVWMAEACKEWESATKARMIFIPYMPRSDSLSDWV